MKEIRSKLSRQLLLVIAIALIIILISLGVILPQTLTPIYEKNLYEHLRQPLELVNEKVEDNKISSEIGYIHIYNNNISISENITSIIKIDDVYKLTKYFDKEYGKFVYKAKVYYYYSDYENEVRRIALTDDTYIKEVSSDLIETIFPIVFITLFVVSLLLIVWGSNVVRKIERLKQKIDHIEDENFDHKILESTNDEIRSLELAIEDMRISLKNQEEYRNQMYQNISHDFKTPLTVIKSYVEAVEDQVEDIETALPIIKDQTSKLENKVHSLLYLNKLDYIKDMNLISIEEININKIIEDSVQKFKYRNKNLEFKIVSISSSKFYGTLDSWETIIDNLLNNAIRYATKEIKITIKKNQIIVYNDGPNIDKNLIDSIFSRYRKGIKGEFGLGLSIVKKTLQMMGYDIMVKNHNKKGVSFIIVKKNSK